jgi:hypothetical protein
VRLEVVVEGQVLKFAQNENHMNIVRPLGVEDRVAPISAVCPGGLVTETVENSGVIQQHRLDSALGDWVLVRRICCSEEVVALSALRP